MPANLPPQYHQVEQRYRQARSVPEKLAALQEMLAIMPKHKGTDHLKADLRAKIARLMDELERPSPSGSGWVQPFSLAKEGAGRAVLVGLPNVGKSLLLAQATGAQTKVGAYPFTTQEPVPGVLRFENVRIQFVDAPPITNQEVQTRLYGLLRNADVLVVVVDLSFDAMVQVVEVLSELERWGFRLLGKGEESDSDEAQLMKRVVIAGNKGDLDGALDQFSCLEATYGERFPVVQVSAAEGMGLEELAREVFTALEVLRVYTKAPGRDPERSEPIVLPRGGTVVEAAELVHREWPRRLRYALLWGTSGKFDAQRVGREHRLADEDVIELHG